MLRNLIVRAAPFYSIGALMTHGLTSDSEDRGGGGLPSRLAARLDSKPDRYRRIPRYPNRPMPRR